MTTKIHLLCNQLGEPLDFRVTAGQVHDSTQALSLLGDHQALCVIADKAYDADAIVQHIQASGAQAVIPPTSRRLQPRTYDRTLYHQRNRIERCFSRLKQFRRFATRYEKNKVCFHAFVALACSAILLCSIVDTA